MIGAPPEDRSWQPGAAIHPPVIDPTARLEDDSVSVDAGLREPTRIGARTWLLKKTHVGHDAQIGADVTITTGAIIGGFAVIEDGAHIGLGAIILPYRRVGRNARVGAGAVITRNVPAGETWVGNPARRLDDEQRDPRPFSER